MTRRWLAVSLAVLLAAALTVLVLHQVRPAILPWDRSSLVAAGYLPSWDGASAASLATAAGHGMTEVSPVSASVNKDGTLAVVTPPAAQEAALRRAGLKVIPTVQNVSGAGFDGASVAELLVDATARARHVQAVLDAAVAGRWSGVDIDYETLPPTAGDAFTSFLSDLRDRLHAHGMLLTVAVPARTTDATSADGLAYAYPLIGRIADEVRVMAYDYSYSTGSPGSVAPLRWVQSVVEYAAARIPRDKLMLGLATYGYDWVGQSGSPLGSADAVKVASRRGVEPRWDAGTASFTFTYEAGGQTHTVWYEDSRSVAAKADLAVSEGLRGLVFWRLGGEDPQIWTKVVATATGGKA
jgi:spore germination protein